MRGLALVACAGLSVVACGDDGVPAGDGSSGMDGASTSTGLESTGTSGATTTSVTESGTESGSGSSDASTGADETTGSGGSSDDGRRDSSTGDAVDPPGYDVIVGDCELLWETTGLDEGGSWLSGATTFRDVDGDGRRDLLTVRALDESTTIETRAGATGAVVDSFDVEGSAYVVLVTDLDGDGLSDIVVQRRVSDGGGGVEDSDGTCTLSGYAGVDGALLWEHVEPEGAQCNFAATAAVGPDLDADGLADIVGGWAFAGGLGPEDAPGRLVVLAASTGDTIVEHDAPIDAIGFGGQVLALGDVDGEAGDEFAVSSFHYPEIGDSAVTVAGLGATTDLWTLTDETGAILHLGTTVDANGDGATDAVATLRELTFADGTQGLVHALDGRTGETLWESESNVINGHYGIALATVGDANADGAVDVAAGVSHLLPNIPTFGLAGQFRVLSASDGHVVAEVEDIPHVDKISGFGGRIAAIDDPTDRGGAALVVHDAGQGPNVQSLGILSAWSCLGE